MNDEITFLSDNNHLHNEVNKPIEFVEDPVLPKKENNYDNNDYVSFPDWDLTPPFDTIDRGDMS